MGVGGRVVGWRMESVAAGREVDLQVWRGVEDNEFLLVGSVTYEAVGTGPVMFFMQV